MSMSMHTRGLGQAFVKPSQDTLYLDGLRDNLAEADLKAEAAT